MLAFLHGFLGSPRDWDKVISFLPYRCIVLEWPFAIPNDAILVGYSMGGRIALQTKQPVIAISAHPGYRSRQEQQQRIDFINFWRKTYLASSLESFLQQWYNQPLFDSLRQHPDFASMLERRKKLSTPTILQQLDFFGDLAPFSYRANTCFLFGETDFKYRILYHELQLNSLCIPRSGHACIIENPRECASIIQTCVEQLSRI